MYIQTYTYIVRRDPYIQCTSMSVNQNRTHNGPNVSDDIGYLGENLSEPKPDVIRMYTVLP